MKIKLVLCAISLAAVICSGNAFATVDGNMALILNNPSDQYDHFEVKNITNVNKVWHHTSPEAIMMMHSEPSTGVIRPATVSATIVSKYKRNCWCKLTATMIANCPSMQWCNAKWYDLSVDNGVGGPLCKVGGYDGKQNANFTADSDNCK